MVWKYTMEFEDGCKVYVEMDGDYTREEARELLEEYEISEHGIHGPILHPEIIFDFEKVEGQYIPKRFGPFLVGEPKPPYTLSDQEQRQASAMAKAWMVKHGFLKETAE
jgi:hypothetical protein